MRIPRSVLTLSSEPVKQNHFATFPSTLVKFMLQPLSPKGCCPVCGEQWAPVVETVSEPQQVYGERDRDCFPGRTGNGVQKRASSIPGTSRVLEYRPTCQCGRTDTVPATVLDCFSGLSTSGQTACYLGHDYIGIELSEQYAKLAEDWIRQKPRWAIRQKKKAATKAAKPMLNQLPLFGME
jgi:hypothetical protein